MDLKHPIKKWEVSIIKLESEEGVRYKITRRLAEMSVAETRIFTSEEDAKRQFEEWLHE